MKMKTLALIGVITGGVVLAVIITVVATTSSSSAEPLNQVAYITFKIIK